MTIKRIGFACKYKADETNKTKTEIKEEEQYYNTKTTTLTFLKDKSENEVITKMNMIIFHNLTTTLRLLDYVSKLPKELHMLRLTSDLLPFYTHESLRFYYDDLKIKAFIESELKNIGHFAKSHNIRLSFHPDQFCVLASDNEEVVKNSIKELEYYTDLAKMMGYAKSFQDLKCNIHISGKLGVEKFIKSFNKLSPETRKILTVENTEFKYGLDDCLKLEKYCPIVLDLHHAWINEEKLIQLNDSRIKRVIDSWQGIRPVLHYSQSKESLFNNQEKSKKLEIKKILASGVTRKQLAAHSDLLWNKEMNEYVKEFRDFFDIMVEAKYKNIAATEFQKNYNI